MLRGRVTGSSSPLASRTIELLTKSVVIFVFIFKRVDVMQVRCHGNGGRHKITNSVGRTSKVFGTVMGCVLNSFKDQLVVKRAVLTQHHSSCRRHSDKANTKTTKDRIAGTQDARWVFSPHAIGNDGPGNTASCGRSGS